MTNKHTFIDRMQISGTYIWIKVKRSSQQTSWGLDQFGPETERDNMAFFVEHPFLALLLIVTIYFTVKKVVLLLFRATIEDFPRKYPGDAEKVNAKV